MSRQRATKGAGSIGKRGKGWYFQIDLGPDPATGKRRRTSQSGFATQREARAALNVALGKVAAGSFVDETAMTVREYVVEQWLPSRKSKVRASTWASYKDALEGRVVPRLGGLKLAALTPKHVSDLYDDLLATGGRDPKRAPGLSARTVSYTGKVLTRALDDAVGLGFLLRNPARSVERPRPRDVEMRAWTAPQARAFLAHVETDRLRALWVLYLTTGLRRGEAIGLRWADLDFDAGRLAVRRTLVAVGYDVQWSEPKTDRSRRVVALDPATVAALRAHRVAQLEERLALGVGYRDDDLVFAKVDGSVLHPQYVSTTFERLAGQLDLPRIRLHDLRHTCATLLLTEGVPLKVVSERLGHSSISITADCYQHAGEQMQTDAADKLGAALFGGVEA